MPIYEYECNLCRCRFERRQRFDEEPLTTCPKCQGQARRVIHSSPIIFKGSGFYVTDSRSTNSAAVGTQANKEQASQTAQSTKDTSNKETDKAVKDSKTEPTK